MYPHEGAVGVMLESDTEGPFQLLSVSPAAPLSDIDTAAGLFEGLASRSADLGLMPVMERIYADQGALPGLRAARDQAYDRHNLRRSGEPTWVCNPLTGGGILDSIQVLGVSLEAD